MVFLKSMTHLRTTRSGSSGSNGSNGSCGSCGSSSSSSHKTGHQAAHAAASAHCHSGGIDTRTSTSLRARAAMQSSGGGVDEHHFGATEKEMADIRQRLKDGLEAMKQLEASPGQSIHFSFMFWYKLYLSLYV